MAVNTLSERDRKSLHKEFAQLSIGLAVWFSLTVYLISQLPAQASQPQETGSGFRPAPEWALKEWKFSLDNPIDLRIRAMDDQEPFIGIGDRN